MRNKHPTLSKSSPVDVTINKLVQDIQLPGPVKYMEVAFIGTMCNGYCSIKVRKTKRAGTVEKTR